MTPPEPVKPPPSRQQLHRKKRRELGLCGREGCKDENGNPKVTGDAYYCDVHAEKERERHRNRWAAKNLRDVLPPGGPR